MSKAILIVDIPEKFEYAVDEIRVDVRGNVYGELIIDYRNQTLTPMPTKKLAIFDPNNCDMEEEIKIIREVDGYNRCIDEILGGTE